MTAPLLVNHSDLAARHSTRLLNDRKQKEADYLLGEYGQLISNLKHYRLSAGLSLDALSRLSYISKNALVRAEQGTYANPMPALTQYWVQRLSISELELTDAYTDFQTSQRERHPMFFGPNLDAADPLSNVHPFRQLRRSHISYFDGEVLPVGVDEVSRALCLPVDTLRYWEKKYRQQQSVPKLVREVLMFIGYKRIEVSLFCDAYETWRSLNLRVQAHG